MTLAEGIQRGPIELDDPEHRRFGARIRAPEIYRCCCVQGPKGDANAEEERAAIERIRASMQNANARAYNRPIIQPASQPTFASIGLRPPRLRSAKKQSARNYEGRLRDVRRGYPARRLTYSAIASAMIALPRCVCKYESVNRKT